MLSQFRGQKKRPFDSAVLKNDTSTTINLTALKESDHHNLCKQRKNDKKQATIKEMLKKWDDQVCSLVDVIGDPSKEAGLLVKNKTIKDNIHGPIEFEPVCMRIIDTIQFQRLRDLHQLGVSRFTYPGATHKRYEHCLGVAYLAERMVRTLQQSQPSLGITDNDVLCVKIAGLCHDLGHGPFSHVFDGLFMKQMNKSWVHEEGSIDMFDHILKKNSIDMSAYGLCEKDVIFIKEMILGHGLKENNCVFHGRSMNQWYLYDIVNNSGSGLDVDKLDYFERDAQHTKTSPKCDYELLIRSARVLPDQDDAKMRHTICFPEKLAQQVFTVFKTRFELHQTVYQHKCTKAMEFMVRDVLCCAENSLRIEGVQISDCPFYMDAFEKLDDTIVNQIMRSDDPKLDAAKKLWCRILNRDLYKFVGKAAIGSMCTNMSTEKIRNDLVAMCNSDKISKDSIIVEKMKIHHGKGRDNPLRHVRFYSKGATTASYCYALPAEMMNIICPRIFLEESVCVYVREKKDLQEVRKQFEAWCKIFNGSNPSSISP